MLKKSRRMSSEEVRRVLSRGRGRRGRFLSLKSLEVPGTGKAAVVVSRKTAKLAVVRNELRRLIYRTLQETELGGRSLIVFVERIPPGEGKKARNRAILAELTELLSSKKHNV